MRRTGLALSLLLGTLAFGCSSGGDDTTSASAASSSSTAGTGGAGGAGGGSATGAGGGSATGAGGSGGMGGTGGDQGGSGGQGGHGDAELSATFVSDSLYADCMPVVAADPLHGGFTVTYHDKGAGPGALTFTDVRLRMGPPGGVVDWPFAVTPSGSGTVPAGAMVDVVHTKVDGSGQGSTGGPCNHCGEPLTLDVTYDDGSSYSWDAGTLDCVY
jgi:hypothetical protein